MAFTLCASVRASADSPWGIVPGTESRLVSHDDPTSEPSAPSSSREQRVAAIASIPSARLTAAARERIQGITDRPTLYRHLPNQTIQCDPELFLCIARQPELLVGIWEVMGITQVKTERLDDFRLLARDGSGTTCTVDLVYGDRSTHVFVADGFYDGKMTASKLTGKGVFVLRTTYQTDVDGEVNIFGTLDCFVQLDNLGADLIARTFGPLIGKTADNNFAETAKFIGQIGNTANHNPDGLHELGMRLPQVNSATKQKFVDAVDKVQKRNEARYQAVSAARAAGVIDPPVLNR